jgi:hypothetical protein
LYSAAVINFTQRGILKPKLKTRTPALLVAHQSGNIFTLSALRSGMAAYELHDCPGCNHRCVPARHKKQHQPKGHGPPLLGISIDIVSSIAKLGSGKVFEVTASLA